MGDFENFLKMQEEKKDIICVSYGNLEEEYRIFKQIQWWATLQRIYVDKDYGFVGIDFEESITQIVIENIESLGYHEGVIKLEDPIAHILHIGFSKIITPVFPDDYSVEA